MAGRDWKVACPSRQTDRPGSFGKGRYCGRGRKGKFKTRLLLGSMIAVCDTTRDTGRYIT